MTTITMGLLAGTGGALVLAGAAWRRRVWPLVAFWGGVSLLLAYLVSVVLVAVVVLAVGGLVWVRRARAASVVNRWGARARRKHGVASTVDIARTASWAAMRRQARTVRPSLRDVTRRERARTRTTGFAIPLCRTGLLRIWASIEDVVLTFGRPRVGKTGWLMGRVIDAPGAVVVTSTRTDIHETTAALRARDGRPVYVFNPTGLGDLPTTITFDPLSGCADPVTAHERATDLLAGGARAGVGDREFWDGQARRVLTALLHAAALGGHTMHDVLQWVANPDTAQRQVMSLLRRSSSAAAYTSDAEQFLTTNDKTRSSTTTTVMPCLGWLASPTACAAATGVNPLDVTGLLRSAGTVYMLGAEESQVAPLVAALTGHIARQARRIAAREPAGRLDPPLTLALDEAALICPVPLDSWTADMGGRGVSIIALFQSRAQLVSRWGDAAARVILNNAGAVMLFSLGADTDDLSHWARLAGERDEVVTNTDAQGRVTSRTTRKVPVVSPTQLTNLPPGRVVVFRRGMPTVLGWAPMAWKRRDVKAQAKLDARETARVTRELGDPVGAATHAPGEEVGDTARWVVDPAGETARVVGGHPPASPASPIPSPARASEWETGTQGGG